MRSGLSDPGEIRSPCSSVHTPQGGHISSRTHSLRDRRDKFLWSLGSLNTQNDSLRTPNSKLRTKYIRHQPLEVGNYLITHRAIFYRGQKLNVMTTYPIDLFSERVIIDACTLGRPPVSKMANVITIGLW